MDTAPQTPPLPSSPAFAAATVAYDVLVVGGGINGAGIARDLAGRGSKVLLCEQHDLAQATSSASTKLIHGGLRYLEYREFGLVRKALAEREVLLKSAPHIMWPLRFVMPHESGSTSARPAWLIRVGLFLYDHLAKREVLPGSHAVELRRHPAGAPLKPGFTRGFVYSDGWVDDARLVVLNAMDAAARGATVLTRWTCVEARRGAELWRVTLRSAAGARRDVTARALVNAAGPWAAQFLADHARGTEQRALRLVKGSHIVVRKLFDHDHAYIFQNADRRIIFAIPYEGDFTLIGTTDTEHHGAIGSARIDDAEIAYLCEQASRYFTRPVRPADVVWTYSGVRPLLYDESSSDLSAVTRDYALELSTTMAPARPAEGAGVPAADAQRPGAPADAHASPRRGRGASPRRAAAQRPGAPLLSVWGGKITTFRKLAEEAADLLAVPLRAQQGAWTRGALLPGADLSGWIGPPQRPDTDFARFVDALRQRHPELPPPLAHRLARAYGSRVQALLGGGPVALSSGGGAPGAATAPAAALIRRDSSGRLGAEVAPGLYEAELRYLHDHEWARSADDVLWRRSKLGLHYDAAQRAAVAAWWSAQWRDGDAGGDPSGGAATAMAGRPAASSGAERAWN